MFEKLATAEGIFRFKLGARSRWSARRSRCPEISSTTPSGTT